MTATAQRRLPVTKGPSAGCFNTRSPSGQKRPAAHRLCATA